MSNIAIRASALRIIELASLLPEKRRRDFEVEAATILKLIEDKKEKENV